MEKNGANDVHYNISAPDGSWLEGWDELNPEHNLYTDDYVMLEVEGVTYGKLLDDGRLYKWHPDGWLEKVMYADGTEAEEQWWILGQEVTAAEFFAKYPVNKKATTITLD